MIYIKGNVERIVTNDAEAKKLELAGFKKYIAKEKFEKPLESFEPGGVVQRGQRKKEV